MSYVYLSLLSSELKRLNIGIAALSEVHRPNRGEIMLGGYNYYWSGHSDALLWRMLPKPDLTWL